MYFIFVQPGVDFSQLIDYILLDLYYIGKILKSKFNKFGQFGNYFIYNCITLRFYLDWNFAYRVCQNGGFNNGQMCSCSLPSEGHNSRSFVSKDPLISDNLFYCLCLDSFINLDLLFLQSSLLPDY